mgnify:FL=1
MRFIKKKDGRIFVRQKDGVDLGVMFKIPSDEYVFMADGRRMFTRRMLKKIHDKIAQFDTKLTIKKLMMR